MKYLKLFMLGISITSFYIKVSRLEKLAHKKALEIHAKTYEEARNTQFVKDSEVMIRVSLLVCEIEKSYELSLVEISRVCKIKYKKPDPEIFYNLVLEKIRGLATIS